ncbi:MAG: amidohydrolase/deacetylase family metallohydrolase [Thermoplasmata archaeon YP2-bin.285]|uniref:Amidohydrolase/deacetylase family metallohydrolase n=1 Tax=Candidatus Sysuiplasma superficiale TaxID=2823368 RepID=A0A8J7YVA4_9ARCH|nr:amidohydrolase/deacetylase family metallohydrolase [Candidatus Sysuiplasma superficiale]
MYDLVVRNGTVIDPSQGINEKMDVAVIGTRIDSIERNIPSSSAARVIDASGLLVFPGLVDIHTHVAAGLAGLCVEADIHCLPKGVTTAVDAGSTGHLLHRAFIDRVVSNSKTRLLAFLNIESLGMIESARTGKEWSSERWAELITISNGRYDEWFVNLEETIAAIRENSSALVGIKWAHHTLNTFRLARKAADIARTRLMAENHQMPEGMKYVRKGDILTHIFHNYYNRLAGGYDGLLEDGEIRQEFFTAYRKGVIFDIGHGRSSFSWDVAEKAMAEGLKPHTISTDIWRENVGSPVRNLPYVMSKMLCAGMSIEEIVAASTVTPARVIGMERVIGSLKPGMAADISIFRLETGRFIFEDSYGRKRKGSRMLRVKSVISNGTLLSS